MTGYESKRAAAQDKLAQPAQEPMAVLFQDGSIVKLENLEFVPEKSGQRVQMLYAALYDVLAGLTEKEKKEIYRLLVYAEGAISLTEAKLKEKNRG